MGVLFYRAHHRWRLERITDRAVIANWRVKRSREIDRGFTGSAGACHALTALVPGGPARIVGMYSSSWMRPSKVRLLIMSRATSG